MKVYIITIEEVFDFQVFIHAPEAFTKEEAAKNRFNEIVEEAKKAYCRLGWVEDKDYYDESCYEIYLDGEYAANHYAVRIHEVELK